MLTSCNSELGKTLRLPLPSLPPTRRLSAAQSRAWPLASDTSFEEDWTRAGAGCRATLPASPPSPHITSPFRRKERVQSLTELCRSHGATGVRAGGDGLEGAMSPGHRVRVGCPESTRLHRVSTAMHACPAKMKLEGAKDMAGA